MKASCNCLVSPLIIIKYLLIPSVTKKKKKQWTNDQFVVICSWYSQTVCIVSHVLEHCSIDKYFRLHFITLNRVGTDKLKIILCIIFSYGAAITNALFASCTNNKIHSVFYMNRQKNIRLHNVCVFLVNVTHVCVCIWYYSITIAIANAIAG